jgi:hypothetical protein
VGLPLSFRLRYDPVFLELGRIQASGRWGALRGVSVHAALSDASLDSQLTSFLILLFGLPTVRHETRLGSVGQLVLLYAAPYAVQLTVSYAPDGLEVPEGLVLVGSASFDHALVEFRWGAEKLLSASIQDRAAVRIALPEGSAEGYRAQDLEARRTGAPALVSEELETGLGLIDG